MGQGIMPKTGKVPEFYFWNWVGTLLVAETDGVKFWYDHTLRMSLVSGLIRGIKTPMSIESHYHSIEITPEFTMYPPAQCFW